MFIGVLSAGTVFFFSRGKRKKKDDVEEQEIFKNSLLCRFVLDGAGKKVGESVAIDEDVLIIKSKNEYLGVPLMHIEQNEKTLLVKGLVEKDKAEMLGEKWRRESFCKMNPSEGEKDGI